RTRVRLPPAPWDSARLSKGGRALFSGSVAGGHHELTGQPPCRGSELGGQVLMHSRDDAGRSQWAVLLDPNGAAFGVIPVGPMEMIPGGLAESGPDRPTGRIAWLDLTVPDAPATRDFYEAVIGWRGEEVAMRDGDESYADYAVLGGAGSATAGICHARGVNAGL